MSRGAFDVLREALAFERQRVTTLTADLATMRREGFSSMQPPIVREQQTAEVRMEEELTLHLGQAIEAGAKEIMADAHSLGQPMTYEEAEGYAKGLLLHHGIGGDGRA